MQTHNIQLDIDTALHNRDHFELANIADALMEQGDDEGAHELRAIVKKWDWEDMAYDSGKDEALLDSY